MGPRAKPRKAKVTRRRVNASKRKAKLHVVSPASAEEIRRSLGISPRVVREVRALLHSLGY
jgi:hypothetical protein